MGIVDKMLDQFDDVEEVIDEKDLLFSMIKEIHDFLIPEKKEEVVEEVTEEVSEESEPIQEEEERKEDD